jgi:hypothetical protein
MTPKTHAIYFYLHLCLSVAVFRTRNTQLVMATFDEGNTDNENFLGATIQFNDRQVNQDPKDVLDPLGLKQLLARFVSG